MARAYGLAIGSKISTLYRVAFKSVHTGCLNFLKLCKVKYYNFSLFHSVQKNLVAQTGDPTGSGKGGESIFTRLYGDQARFFEMETTPRIKHKTKGTVSMVNNGSDMHGSQFFITLGEDLDYLDNKHTVFGQVEEGDDVLSKLNEAYCDEEHRPYVDIRIYHTVIIDDPFDDPPDLQIPDRSPEPTKEILDSGRIRADEEIDDTKGLSMEQISELTEEKEAKANTQILEMVGDLPDVDVKPPDNVLFVCKLNPVTTSDDLEMIFSRFGEISSCEVIKDQKTGESLQYAFIEFEKPEDCEGAYFKMDNVLIDDRRIHVDFSQSVSKLKEWKQEKIIQKYVLKDKGKKDGYDLVFDHNASSHSSSKKAKEKKKKQRHDAHSSDSDDQSHKRSSKKKKKQERESTLQLKSRSRSRSPERVKKDKKRGSERDRRNRSRSPADRYRDDRYRDDSRSSRRDRDRRR